MSAVPASEKVALRVDEAAELLSVSVPTLYRLMRAGEIRYHQPRGMRLRLLSRRELERWIDERVADHAGRPAGRVALTAVEDSVA